MTIMGRRNNIVIWLGFILILVSGNSSIGQPQRISLPAESGEKIVLYSDRSMYGISEDLYYTASYQKPESAGDLEWSTVLYVELVQWNGAQLAQSKSPIVNGMAYGMLRIPDNIKSGNYYLRAYTRWMRNYSPYDFAYLPLTIINYKSILIDRGPENGDAFLAAQITDETAQIGPILISDVNEVYGKRQLVEMEIALQDPQLEGTYCLSVTKDGEEENAAGSFSFKPVDQSEYHTLEFLPETEGITVSGKIIDQETDTPVPGVKINLSSYSGSFFFSSVLSEEDGTFFFVLPRYEGSHEFHLSHESSTSESYQILVTNEFCHRIVNLPYKPFQLLDSEREVAGEIILNAQLGGKYVVEDTAYENRREIHKPFYGVPGSVTYEKDYIELNNLEELFFEVVHDVDVGVSQGKPTLAVNGPTSLVAYPPLILMDNIPVTHIGNLLKTGTRRIDRVEVVDHGYVLGDFKYRGIISVYSENRDMAGMEITGVSHFFNYQLFSKQNPVFPVYSESKSWSPVADRRNTLYWDPALKLTAEGRVKVSFYTSDAPGEYAIQLRSTDLEGPQIVSKKVRFLVD